MAYLDTRIVLAQDTTANLSASHKIFMRGEMVIELCEDGAKKIKIGDGIKEWSDLPYAAMTPDEITDLVSTSVGEAVSGATPTVYTTTYTGEGDITDLSIVIAADEQFTDVTFIDGDVLVVKDVNGVTTGYQRSNGVWAAFTGNVSADNVIMGDETIFAGTYGSVGNIKLSNGAYKLDSAGMSLTSFIETMFTKEEQPTKTNPSITITLTGAGAYEVGDTATLSYTVNWNEGKYTYDSTTGVAKPASVNISDGTNSYTDWTGTLSNVTVADNTNYKLTGTVTYADGNVAKTNLKKDSNPVVQITAGTTTSVSSSAVTGYRKMFYGSSTSIKELTSDNIRALANGEAAKAKEITVSIVEGAKQVVIAVPSGRTVTSIKDENNSKAEVFDAFTSTTVDVEGLNGSATKSYNVYYYTTQSGLGKNRYFVTVS